MNNNIFDERSIQIQCFRNIGIETPKNPKSAKFLINRGLQKDTAGDLIIIVAGNNDGKTNLIKAIKNLNQKIKNDNLLNKDFYDVELAQPFVNQTIVVNGKEDDSSFNVYSAKIKASLQEKKKL